MQISRRKKEEVLRDYRSYASCADARGRRGVFASGRSRGFLREHLNVALGKLRDEDCGWILPDR